MENEEMSIDHKENSGAWNSGNLNSGAWNSGAWNSGAWNSGAWNSGDRNSGNRNSGDRNSGNLNSGDRNSGNWNSGAWNSGNWNSTSFESGHFNTILSETIRVFDADCDRHEWGNAKKPDCLFFDLTEWVEDASLAEGGYLKTYGYKEAFTASMEKATPEEIEQIKALPNFDAQKFFEISGFMIKDTVTITVQGKDIEISADEFESIKSQFLK
jgi:hypothetical protein